jgi:CBS domain containing-hemolysin-like protein
MTWIDAVLIAILLPIHTLASYVDRLYSEMGKFLSREFQDNIDHWEREVEPRLGLPHDRLALSAAVLAELSFGCLALVFGAMLFEGAKVQRAAFMWPRPGLQQLAQAVLAIVLVATIFSRLLPFILFTRTTGQWAARVRVPLRVLFICVLPVTLFLGFLLSIASLAEPASSEEEENSSEAVDALIEAGEEEGIFEESDRELIRSAVEFGEKIVREVMTPRPSMFAVPATMTLEAFLAALKERPYSRVPVFEGSIDHITGIAFAHDLLQIADTDAGQRTLETIQRPALFVPETKHANELLREMQRDKQHMCIAIDEYGGVAGLVTIEDLLEEIVGAITDEHEINHPSEAPVKEADGVWIIPGSLEIEELDDLLEHETLLDDEDYEATTVAGLVSEVAGRIPLAGEVVVVHKLRFEVLASTDRRIDRLRISAETNGAAETASRS